MTDTPESIGRLTFAAREAWATWGCIVSVHPPLCPQHGEPWDAVVTGPLGDRVFVGHGATEREVLEATIAAAGRANRPCCLDALPRRYHGLPAPLFSEVDRFEEALRAAAMDYAARACLNVEKAIDVLSAVLRHGPKL